MGNAFEATPARSYALRKCIALTHDERVTSTGLHFCADGCLTRATRPRMMREEVSLQRPERLKRSGRYEALRFDFCADGSYTRRAPTHDARGLFIVIPAKAGIQA